MAGGEEASRPSKRMGYQGKFVRGLFSVWSWANHFRQQLLEIWNKAKGKERDAMLWGDEVTLPASHANFPALVRANSPAGGILGCGIHKGRPKGIALSETSSDS